MYRGDSATFGVMLVAVLLVILAGVTMYRSPTIVAPLDIVEVQYSVDTLELFVQMRLERLVSEAMVCTTCQEVSFSERIRELRRDLYLIDTNVYGLLRGGSYTVTPVDEGFEVVFQEIWVQGRLGETSVKRSFDAAFVVAPDGTLVRNIYKQN